LSPSLTVVIHALNGAEYFIFLHCSAVFSFKYWWMRVIIYFD